MELLCSLVIAASLAVAELGISGAGGVVLGLGVWLAFPVTILAGSVVWTGCRGGSPRSTPATG